MMTEPNSLAWRKSTFSGGGNDCVEMADTGAGIAMRNSNHPDDGTIVVAPGPFADLVACVKAGEIDDLA